VGIAEDHYAKKDEQRRQAEEAYDIRRYNHLVGILEEVFPLLVARTKKVKTMPKDHVTVLVDKSTDRYEIAWRYSGNGHYYIFLQSGKAAIYTPTHQFRKDEATVLNIERISIGNTVGAFKRVADGTENAVLYIGYLEELVDGVHEVCHTFGIKYKRRWYREDNDMPFYLLTRKGAWAD